MTTEKVTLDFEGSPLAGVVTGTSEQPLVLLLHGGPGGTKEGPADLFVRLADELQQYDVASARFDFAGEGESGGSYADTTPSAQVRQYELILSALRERGHRRIGVVGESFGATCALDGYRPGDMAALVLLWPAIWLLDGTFAPFVTDVHLREAEERGFIEVDGQRVGRAYLQELLRRTDREPELRRVVAPTLLIHGDADTEVPWIQSARAHEVLPHPKKLIVVPGGDHCLREPGEQQLVVEHTVDWLIRHLSTTTPTID